MYSNVNINEVIRFLIRLIAVWLAVWLMFFFFLIDSIANITVYYQKARYHLKLLEISSRIPKKKDYDMFLCEVTFNFELEVF